MNIIRWAFKLVSAAEKLVERARGLYYAVMLMGYACPQCRGRLGMIAEGRCRCEACGFSFDPTLLLQCCGACGGKLELRVRRYRCADCGADVASRFLFDGLVFDADYFRQKMTESRQRKRELRERVRKMLAESRSPALESVPADLEAIPGLTEALNGLIGGTTDPVRWQPGAGFDLKRYQSHVEAHILDFPIGLDEIPSLTEDTRKDLIWRFVAIIFMAHAGLVDVWQKGSTIWVMRHEARGPILATGWPPTGAPSSLLA